MGSQSWYAEATVIVAAKLDWKKLTAMTMNMTMKMTITMIYRTAVPELRLLSTPLPGTQGGQAKLQVFEENKYCLHLMMEIHHQIIYFLGLATPGL